MKKMKMVSITSCIVIILNCLILSFSDVCVAEETLDAQKERIKKCIKCFGCRNACPICYCQECTLELSAPEWIDKGKIPPSPLFHLERLIHMVESCTNCGQCEDVCPMDIPLAKIWHQINLRVNELKYSPGMDSKDLVIFDYFKRPE